MIREMILALTDAEKVYVIKKILVEGDSHRYIESLGFVCGGCVTVVSKTDNGVIVNVKDSRVAISNEIACKIIVEPE